MPTVSMDTLREIAETLNLDEDAIRTNYSGRGMYGAECVGFDLDYTSDLYALGRVVQQVAGDESEAWGSPSTDGMGRGLICYWRRLTVEPASASV